MSATVIVVYSSFSLLHALLMAAGGAAAAAGLGKAMLDRGEKSLEETREILQKRMDDEITAELGRMSGKTSEAAWKKLNGELEVFRDGLGDRLARDDSMQSAVADFHALQQRIREEELDTQQCETRLKEIKDRIHALRAEKIKVWEKALDRLEAAATSEQLASLSAYERLVELQGILLELEEMKRMAAVAAEANIDDLRETRWAFEDVRSIGGDFPDDGPDDRHARLLLVREIHDMADRIAQTDEAEGEKLRSALEGLSVDTPFPDRLRALRRQLRAQWGQLRERVALTALFREKLEALYSVVQAANSPEGEDLAHRCELLCGGKYIDRAAFMALYEDICRFAFARTEAIADNLFAEKVENALGALGYELLSDAEPENDAGEAPLTEALLPEQIRYLDSPYEGYRIMAKAGKRGTFTARLIRAVATEEEKENTSEYQRQKDLETGQKWCRDFDSFLERLKEQGMPLDVTLRVEPEDSEVLVVVNRELAQKSTRDAKKRRTRKTLAQKMREQKNAREGEAAS